MTDPARIWKRNISNSDEVLSPNPTVTTNLGFDISMQFSPVNTTTNLTGFDRDRPQEERQGLASIQTVTTGSTVSHSNRRRVGDYMLGIKKTYQF